MKELVCKILNHGFLYIESSPLKHHKVELTLPHVIVKMKPATVHAEDKHSVYSALWNRCLFSETGDSVSLSGPE